MTVALHCVVDEASDGSADAPVLVMAGSLGSTTEMWRPQVSALTERFRVVRVDLRGHGGSPATPGAYLVADLADDVRALLDRLGSDRSGHDASTPHSVRGGRPVPYQRVDWCGLSIGAMVGMHLASESPERVHRLVLCCTTAWFPDPGVYRQRMAAVAGSGTASIARSVVERWFTPGWRAAHPDAVADAEAMVAGITDEGYAGCCAALAAWDHRDRLPAITAPTLVVAGRDDPATPVEMARTLAAGIPDARLEVVDGAHLANIESADAVNALLTRFLDSR